MVPLTHLAIIPDGNRRYAAKENLDLETAYRRGFEKAEEVFDWALTVPSIKTVTIYAFSTENFSRPFNEQKILFPLYKHFLSNLIHDKKIAKDKIRVNIVGEPRGLEMLRQILSDLQAATSGNDRYTLNIALGYGSRAELIDVANKAFHKINSEEEFALFLQQPQDIDLLIRTGGQHRLSNFMLWQSAYAELYFTDKLWPDFTKSDFNAAIAAYKSTDRHFGV